MLRKGCYQLLIHLARCRYIRIGRLGVFSFPRGWYIYTGSALCGLDGRIARHLRRAKKLFWHIDYLLQHAQIVSVTAFETTSGLECRLSREALARPGARVIAPRFGSSDCNCAAHLVYLGRTYESLQAQDKSVPDSAAGI
jgi:sugar fermentation stimulation protein A